MKYISRGSVISMHYSSRYIECAINANYKNNLMTEDVSDVKLNIIFRMVDCTLFDCALPVCPAGEEPFYTPVDCCHVCKPVGELPVGVFKLL